MISFFIYAIVTTGILLTSFYIFAKSIQYDATINQKIIIVSWCLLLSALYQPASFLMPLLLFRFLACLASIFLAFFLTKQKFETAVSAFLLAFGLSYCLYFVAAFFVAFVLYFFIGESHIPGAPLNLDRFVFLVSYFLVIIMQFILAFFIFRIRRFRKGFPFIFNRYTIIVSLIFAGTIMIFVTWFILNAQAENAYGGYLYFAGVITAGIGIYILIRRLITSYQRKRAQQNREIHFEKRYHETKEKYERLIEQDKAKQAVIHNFVERIEALENAFKNNNAALKDIQNLKYEFSSDISAIKGKISLPSTKIGAIDNLLNYFASKFSDDGIDFNVIVNGSIIFMVDKVIAQGKLETIIANHLKDAQTAVNAGNNPFRSITAVLGLVDGHYEFAVFDSGIPFEVDTLERLGTDRVTTHAENGGSGIGFMTTFEILKECNASLIISEQESSPAEYSKSVSIRFNDENQYIIKTHRPDCFKPNRRYSVEVAGSV